MAITREVVLLRVGNQAGDCNARCVNLYAFGELHGAGRAVVRERLTQLR